ncbi:MFS transporter, partial [Burkholderia multivorans]
ALLGVGGFYLVTAFCVYYGVNILGYDDSLLLLGSMVAAAVEILILIWGGMLRAKYGASKVILWGGIASAVIAVPAFLLFESGQPVLIVIAMTIAVGALSLPY